MAEEDENIPVVTVDNLPEVDAVAAVEGKNFVVSVDGTETKEDALYEKGKEEVLDPVTAG